MPKVSILIATCNRARLISKAIKSVLDQSFKDWEIIVANDASTDNTEKVVKEWQEKISNLKYVKSDVNIGIARVSNLGLRQAQGEYVAILDDDDCWLDPDKLKKQIEFLDNNKEYVGVGGGMIVVDKDGKELFHFLKAETDEQIRKKMLFDNPMANSATVFRQSVAEQVRFYDESLRYSADRDFWLKMGLKGKLYNFPQYFAYYLMGGQNTSIIQMRHHLNSSLKVMKRYKNDYPSYWVALLFNRVQYVYAFLPNWLKKILHKNLSILKRIIFQ